MPKKPKTDGATAPQTREEMEALIREICTVSLLASSLVIDMETEKLAVAQRYEDRITAAKKARDDKMELAEAWALAHPEEFASKKSVVMIHGTVGYRTGMPKLKTLRGYTWARVLKILKKAAPKFVRRKEEVAKDLLLEGRDKIGSARLKKFGLLVDQAESFFVEPHEEECLKS